MKHGRFFSLLWASLFATSSVVNSNANSLDLWQPRSATAPTVSFQDIVYGNSLFIAVGGNNNLTSIYTSGDAENWTPQILAIPDQEPLTSVAFGNGIFVAASFSSNFILTSTNGTNWASSRIEPFSSFPVGKISFANGWFFTQSQLGYLYSSPDGTNWTASASPLPGPISRIAYGVTLAGNGTYVGVGAGGSILTSSNAVTWVSRVSGTTNDLNDVRYSREFFYAVGLNGTFLGSMSGQNWSGYDLEITNDFYAVAFPDDSPGVVAGNYQMGGSFSTFRGVAYGNGTFAMVGDAQTGWSPGPIATSKTGGDTWNFIFNVWQGTIYGNRKFLTVGAMGNARTSTNGVDWTRLNTSTTNDLYAAAYGGGQFIAVGDLGTIVSSPDGTNWTSRSSGTNTHLSAITFGNQTFVAVGNSPQDIMLVSTNGVDWTKRSTPIPSNLTGIAYGNGMFLAVGKQAVLGSTNGYDWIVLSTKFRSYYAVAFGNGRFVAVGAFGNFMSTKDGSVINEGSLGMDLNQGLFNDLRTITCGAGVFLAATTQGGIMSSIDGVSWTSRPSPVADSIYGASYGNGSFVLTGNRGTILQSGPVFSLQTRRNPANTAFDLILTGEIGRSYTIQTVGNVYSGTWTDWITVTNTLETIQFTDSSVTNGSIRFYRAIAD